MRKAWHRTGFPWHQWLAGLLLLANVCSGWGAERQRLVFSRVAPTRIGLFLADADGRNERPLLPPTNLDYNASFSVDGQWIIFTSERRGSADIYRVHPDGSGMQRLVEDPSYDDQAALSPDGRTLAFVSTRGGGTANIWLLDLGTRQATNLTRNTAGNFRPSWSPDGQWIAFSSDRDTRPGRATPSWELMQSTAIYIIRADGTRLRRLTELGGYHGSPQWSRDGQRIVCYESTPRDVHNAGMDIKPAESQVISINLATGGIERHPTGAEVRVSPRYLDDGDIAYVVTHRTHSGVQFANGRRGIPGGQRCPSWAPDGKTMVYHRSLGRDLGLAPVASLDQRFELFSTSGEMLSYSSSGDQLAMAPYSDRSLVVMAGDGHHVQTIYDGGSDVVAFPAWSPNGKQIVFGLGGFFDRPVRSGQLALIRPDGSGLRMLTEGKTSSGLASWSPDGKQLVYRVMGNGQQGLRILALETCKITTLTSEYDTFPAWSPRGDCIAFCSFREADYDIYTVRPDGTDVRKLTDSHGNDAHPIWSPAGNWIVFSSSRKGFKDEAMLDEWGPQPYGELFVMRRDGSEVTQLTDNQWEDATPAWRPSR